MSSRPASLLQAYLASPDFSRDAVAYETVRRGLCRAISGPDTVSELIGVLASLSAWQSWTKPLNRSGRDDFLRLTARAHIAALNTLSQWYTPDQIDQGMQALASRIIVMAESEEQRAGRPKQALVDIQLRLMFFRNLLENLILAENAARDLVDEAREGAIARMLGLSGPRRQAWR